MKIFAIGDLHLSFDEKVDKPMDIFGPSWENYETRLSENWKKLVSDEDLVLIPGDISWAMRLEEATADLVWVDKLPGKKIIIRGNHDLWFTSLKKLNGKFDTITFLKNDSYVDLENKVVIAGSRGWLSPGDANFAAEDTKIFAHEELRLGFSIDDAKKKVKEAGFEMSDFLKIGMTHFPPGDLKTIFEKENFSIVVYGHLHTAKAFAFGPEGSINGVNYSLVSLDKLNCVPKLIACIE